MSDSVEELIGPPAGLRDLCLYTPQLARAGYGLNRFFASLAFDQLEHVTAFQADPEAYMDSANLPEHERALVRRRDFNEILEAGGQPFVLFRAFNAMGWTPRDMVRKGADGGSRLMGALQRGGYIEESK